MSADAAGGLPTRRTLGIGSMVVDRVMRVPRILGNEEKGILRPFPDGSTAERHVGGVVLNHLGWAAALGLPVGVFGKQADDAEGRFLRAAMDAAGIDRSLVLDGSASSRADIYVDDAGGRAIYMAPAATSETTPAFIREHHAERIAGAARITTEISQLPLDAVVCVLELAHEAGVPTLLDLDVAPSDAVGVLGSEQDLHRALALADVLKPAKAAARELVPDAGDDPLSVARALRERFGNEAVVVTDGEEGCAISAEQISLRVPAAPVSDVVDTTGAGDAFLGGLLVGLAADLGWEDTGRLAQACGASCVERLGAFPEDPAHARATILRRYTGGPLPAWVGVASARPAANAAGENALAAYGVAANELQALGRRLDGSAFDAAVALIQACGADGGRVHVTGVGKPEHVAHYAASVLSSTGTPASFLHGTEATHGSAGQVCTGDVVIAISNSGTTRELLATVDTVKGLGARVLAVTGDVASPLAAAADAVLEAGVSNEGGGLGLAPRASVAAELLVLAALSAALEEATGFDRAAYHARHPAGALGEKSGR